ncbi:DDB1- and CUL4-associated factor 11 isoform X2 [Onthophagus taurus]|uniref:DDB1- and CUL4-associated factor 11 isoform X2 n=1 Tax=Onthophagus taurus TaxID=166361 RepID=UPI000C1FF21D|nr:DDB1- and CUL4-associated factor 11 isoform X2 [Onthophagus taurus]
MGPLNSRTMGDDDSRSSDYDSDNDEVRYDLIQRIINSPRERVDLSEYTYSCEQYGARLPKVYRPCVKRLSKSHFYFSTKIASGLITSRRRPVGNNITSMLLNRERNMCPYEKFSRPNKIRIENWFLPNTMEEIDRYSGKAFCGVFSNDGNYFITGAQDQKIRVYDSSDHHYKLKFTIPGRDIGWSILDVSVSPTRKHFVYSTWSSQIQLCSLDDPDKQMALNLIPTSRRFAIFALAFSADGRDVLCAGNDGHLHTYNIDRNEHVHGIRAHDFDVNSIAFADDSSHVIFSGGDDGLVRVWDRRTLGDDDCKPVGMLAGHKDGITHICSRGDNRHLISNSKDQTIKLWDLRMFSDQTAIESTQMCVKNQTWDYRWQGVPKNMMSTKSVLPGDSSILTMRGHVVTRTLIRARFSPLETTGQRYIYTGCGYGRLIIYDALTGRVKRSLKEHSVCVRDISWHPTRPEILTSSWDKTVGRWTYKYIENNNKSDGAASENGKTETVRRSPRIALQQLKNASTEGEEGF